MSILQKLKVLHSYKIYPSNYIREHSIEPNCDFENVINQLYDSLTSIP